MTEPSMTIEHITDPAYCARAREQHERALRNSRWLAAHWPELLPHARGRFVAVAGEQAFVADTATDAWSQARAAHPDDDGAVMQYVRAEVGPRIYANCR
ncbi:MAG: hypothetical protein ACJ8F7_08785 [Gemmataceae bacterium]